MKLICIENKTHIFLQKEFYRFQPRSNGLRLDKENTVNDGRKYRIKNNNMQYIERNSKQSCHNYRKWHKSIGGTVCTWNFTCSPSKTCSLALFFGAVAIRFYDLCKLPHISNHAKTCNRFLSFIDFVVDIHIRPMQHSTGFLFY